MSSRLLGVICLTALLAAPTAGCRMMSPGNEGWFCESDEDCKEGLDCRTYKHKGKDHENKLCTGKYLLKDTGKNYGWIFLIGTWFMLVVFPVGLVVFVFIARFRLKKKEAEEARQKALAAQGGDDQAAPEPPESEA